MSSTAFQERRPSRIRRWWDRLTGRAPGSIPPPAASPVSARPGATPPDAAATGPDPTVAAPESPGLAAPTRRARAARLVFGPTRRAALLRAPLWLGGLVALWFGVGGMVAHRVDDDTAFRPEAPPAGASHAVAMASALIEREAVLYEWSANDPWFMPDSLLDNGPNFQRGLVAAVGRFTFEMVDQLGRVRGSSLADPDLERAAGFLQFPPDVWHFEPEKSWLPAVPSEDQYRAGGRALASYNARLAQGQAVFDRRADSLAATVARVAADLGSQSAMIDAHLTRESGRVLNTHADDIFWQTKGRLYAYYLLLRELGRDFEPVIQERNLGTVWSQSLDSLREAASLHPVVVLDGAPAGTVFANHLAVQGFKLLRTLVKLNEVVKVAAV